MSLDARLKQREVMNPVQRGLVGLMVAAAHVQQTLGELCQRHGITFDQYNVLRILRGAHPRGHPRYEIGARAINRAPDVTRLLDRLEQRGLIERVRSDEDRRLSLSRITTKGMRLLDAMAPEFRRLQEELAAPLTERELQVLATIGDKLAGEIAP